MRQLLPPRQVTVKLATTTAAARSQSLPAFNTCGAAVRQPLLPQPVLTPQQASHHLRPTSVVPQCASRCHHHARLATSLPPLLPRQVSCHLRSTPVVRSAPAALPPASIHVTSGVIDDGFVFTFVGRANSVSVLVDIHVLGVEGGRFCRRCSLGHSFRGR
jgi:hypothetical protein